MPADIHILADKRLTKQILINLLSNAIKFTPDGGSIITGVSRPGRGGWKSSVADTGIGMDAAQMEKAFSPYGQINSRMRAGPSGHGAWASHLPIAGATARRRSDRQSTPGQGTRMMLILPQSRVVHAEPQPVFSVG